MAQSAHVHDVGTNLTASAVPAVTSRAADLKLLSPGVAALRSSRPRTEQHGKQSSTGWSHLIKISVPQSRRGNLGRKLEAREPNRPMTICARAGPEKFNVCLALRSAGTAHDRPDIDNLFALGDVVAVVVVGTVVKDSAIDVHAIAQFWLAVTILPL